MILIIKHISIEKPGIIAEFFKNTAWEIKIVELDKGDKLPEKLSEIEAVISLGGPMNVYEEDKFSFLKQEDIFLKKATEEEMPILGICLGAQLLAKACGAKIEKAQNKEIGWYKVNLTQQGKKDPLFSGLNDELDVFQWHEDTFAIPQGARLLGTSNLCKNQAFCYAKNAYGLQFHIEVTPSMVESWVNEYLNSKNKNEISYAQKMVIDAYRKQLQFEVQTKTILLNFSRLITEKITL